MLSKHRAFEALKTTASELYDRYSGSCSWARYGSCPEAEVWEGTARNVSHWRTDTEASPGIGSISSDRREGAQSTLGPLHQKPARSHLHFSKDPDHTLQSGDTLWPRQEHRKVLRSPDLWMVRPEARAVKAVRGSRKPFRGRSNSVSQPIGLGQGVQQENHRERQGLPAWVTGALTRGS